MLREYRRKRNFSITPEPAGHTSTDELTRMPRKKTGLSFVIQKHTASRLHYDFRLEVDGVMVSWAVPKGPSLSAADKRLAVMTEDHPMEYSDFEGVIPEHQYGAGEVIIWDRGIYSPDEDSHFSWGDKVEANKRMRQGLKNGKLSFFLQGEKLKGSWTLVKLRGKGKEWLLIKHRDQYEDSESVVTEQAESVISGRSIEDLQKHGADSVWTAQGAKPAGRKVDKIKDRGSKSKTPGQLVQSGKKEPFPRHISPMLSTLIDAPFSSPGWFFEPKLDGVRAIAYIKDGAVRLRSRRGLDLTDKYPVVCRSLKHCQRNFVLDGEVVALDEKGRPSFQQLQQRGGRLASFGGKGAERKAPLIYYVFDILYADGKKLTGLTVGERKKILKAVLPVDNTVKLVESLGEDGEAAFAACVKLGLEGIIAKKDDSLYEEGKRGRSWLKIKTALSDEFLVCGYTEGTGARRSTFGSLILGEHDSKGSLQYVGGVGTGFSTKTLKAILKRMEPLVTKKCPFASEPPGKLNPTWIKPELVAEVKFLERTRDRSLRAPVFMHLREDIEPDKVKEATVLHADFEKKSGVLAGGKNRKAKKEESGRSQKGSDKDERAREAKTSAAKGRSKKAAVTNFKSPEEVEAVLAQLDNEKEKLSLEVDNHQLALSNLNKVFWPPYGGHPAITKRDYVRYLALVSPYLIPHMTNRMITLVRFPNGIGGGRFYQKHWEHDLPEFVETASIFTEQEERDQQFLVCNNLPTLLWLGQIADLELHTAHTRVTSQPDAPGLSEKMTGSLRNLDSSIGNYPDFVVLDLDPYLYSGKEKKGAEPELHRKGFEKACEIALYLKEHLDKLKLRSYVKTSGRTGLHIYIPIERNVDYDTVREISSILCQQVQSEHPDETTMKWSVKKRPGKVFLDHNMNARSKSLASIYSPRVAPEAAVSTAVAWDELPSVYPTDFDMRTVPERLAAVGDLWKDILKKRNDLRRTFKAEVKARK